MEQHRGRAAAAMAKAAGQGNRSRHRCGALRAQSNIAARTPPASQNVLRVRPRPNRGRNRTRAARDAARADLQSLEPNPIGPRKAPHKCPTATPTALRGPAAFAGARATAAPASSRSERPTSRDGGRERRRREKNTHTRHGRPHRCSAERRGPPGPPMRVGEPQIYRETAFERDGRHSNENAPRVYLQRPTSQAEADVADLYKTIIMSFSRRSCTQKPISYAYDSSDGDGDEERPEASKAQSFVTKSRRQSSSSFEFDEEEDSEEERPTSRRRSSCRRDLDQSFRHAVSVEPQSSGSPRPRPPPRPAAPPAPRSAPPPADSEEKRPSTPIRPTEGRRRKKNPVVGWIKVDGRGARPALDAPIIYCHDLPPAAHMAPPAFSVL